MKKKIYRIKRNRYRKEKKIKSGLIFRIALLCIGVLLILDTLFVMGFSNFNFGVILPTILGLPLLIIGIFFPSFARHLKSSRFLRFLRIFIISAYAAFLVVVLVTGSILFAASVTAPSENADAVIVLGAGIHGDEVSLLLGKRLRAAINYKLANPETIIVVSGGQGPGESITEAEAMKRFLLANGVNETDIIKEEASTSTQENFRFSKRILDERFPDGYSCVYVTSDFHIFRAGLVAKKEGLNAEGLSGKGTAWYIMPNCYLREIAAVWAYFILGWM